MFERRDRELEEAGGDLSMFAGDRGGAEAGKVCLPWTNLSEQLCVRTGLCMYLFSFSLSLFLLPLPQGIASPLAFQRRPHRTRSWRRFPPPPRPSLSPARLPAVSSPGGHQQRCRLAP